jgi:hypothetical protein
MSSNEYKAEPARDGTDGYVVKQEGVGIVCYCFDDSGVEARQLAALLNNRQAVANLVAAANLTIVRAGNAGFSCDALREAVAVLQPEPTYAEKLHSGARLHVAHGADIETAKRMAALAIRAGEEDH